MFVLTAAIGSASSLPWPFVSLASGDFRMWPLTAERLTALGADGEDVVPLEGFAHLTPTVLERIAASAQQPLAYVEVDLWAGEGTQAAIVVHQGEIVVPTLTTGTDDPESERQPMREKPVNTALRRLGVRVDGEIDEFDMVGLGRHRSTDDWVGGTSLASALRRLGEHLEARGATLTPGLSNDEITYIEGRWSFEIPPDLREVLEWRVPTGKGFVDWRNEDDIQATFDWPADRIAFDVMHNKFWLPEWGVRPDADDDAVSQARRALGGAPTLIPLANHRYLVGEPAVSGNPILSVYQADITFYGDNLADWFHRAYRFGRPSPGDGPNRTLGLWERFL